MLAFLARISSSLEISSGLWPRRCRINSVTCSSRKPSSSRFTSYSLKTSRASVHGRDVTKTLASRSSLPSSKRLTNDFCSRLVSSSSIPSKATRSPRLSQAKAASAKSLHFWWEELKDLKGNSLSSCSNVYALAALCSRKRNEEKETGSCSTICCSTNEEIVCERPACQNNVDEDFNQSDPTWESWDKNALKYNDFTHAIWWICNTKILKSYDVLESNENVFLNLPEPVRISVWTNETLSWKTIHLWFLVRIQSITDGLLILSDKTHCRQTWPRPRFVW